MSLDAQSVYKEAADRVIARVRRRMRDYAVLNRLVEGEESSNRFIAGAIDTVISNWNSTPPLVGGVDVRSIAPPSELSGTFEDAIIAELLDSVAILQERNNLPYNDGQISVSSSSKGSAYLRIAQKYAARHELHRQRYKMALNIQGGWGEGIGSDYAALSVADMY